MSERFDYLIVGGGMVADAAARGIRERDEHGSIGILSEDVDPPYTRPALTKKLWTDPDFTWDKVPLGTADDTGATIRLGTRVESIDRQGRTVTTDAGDPIEYGALLIATGGHPKPLPLPEDERVILFRSADDYRRLRELAARHPHIGVVGGSFIGTELAAALVQNGCEVTLFYPDETLGGSMFPPSLAARFEDAFSSAGVHLRASVTVDGGDVDASGIALRCSDGSSLTVDAVASGLGIEPATAFADAAGLAMAGETAPYTHTPYFYSNVFEISYEALGTIDANLETVEDWVDPLNVGVIYYLDKGVVAGVLLWNVPDRRDAARRVLASAHSLTRDNLPGLIAPD